MASQRRRGVGVGMFTTEFTGRCWNCGERGHERRACPLKLQAEPNAGISRPQPQAFVTELRSEMEGLHATKCSAMCLVDDDLVVTSCGSDFFLRWWSLRGSSCDYVEVIEGLAAGLVPDDPSQVGTPWGLRNGLSDFRALCLVRPRIVVALHASLLTVWCAGASKPLIHIELRVEISRIHMGS